MIRRLAITLGRLFIHALYLAVCWLLEEPADDFAWYQRGPEGAEA